MTAYNKYARIFRAWQYGEWKFEGLKMEMYGYGCDDLAAYSTSLYFSAQIIYCMPVYVSF